MVCNFFRSMISRETSDYVAKFPFMSVQNIWFWIFFQVGSLSSQRPSIKCIFVLITAPIHLASGRQERSAYRPLWENLLIWVLDHSNGSSSSSFGDWSHSHFRLRQNRNAHRPQNRVKNSIFYSQKKFVNRLLILLSIFLSISWPWQTLLSFTDFGLSKSGRKTVGLRF